MTATALGASFRDPSGFVSTVGHRTYRQVNRGYQRNMLSLAHGMTLRDASAYNVQFVGRRRCS